MCNMISERISAAYFINPSHQSVSICVYPIIASQRFGKNIAMATNTYATIGKLLIVLFSMRTVSYQEK
jgi:hypothetical protein